MPRKKTNLFAAILLGSFAAGIIFSTAWAQSPDSGNPKENENSAPDQIRSGRPANVQVNEGITVNQVPVPNKGQKGKNAKSQPSATNHRSAVSAFVQNILAVADREGGIGDELRSVAKEQNDSKEKVAEGVEIVKSRSKIKTFFFGTDYKNTGALRSEMAKTENQIEQLKRLAEKTENQGNKIRLEAQTQSLSIQQSQIQNFVDDNEKRFSLFGWAVKRFQ